MAPIVSSPVNDVSRAGLIARAKERCNMEDSNFVGTTAWNSHADNAVRLLYNKLLAADNDFYFDEVTFTTVAGQAAYDIQGDLNIFDFFRLRGLDLQVTTTDWVTIRKFNFRDRNRFMAPFPWNRNSANGIRYRLRRTEIWLQPAPIGVYTLKMLYNPTFAGFASDDDTFDGINGFEEWVVLEMAIRALGKEEGDTGDLRTDQAKIEQEIAAMAMNRDAGEEEQAVDIYKSGFYDDDYFDE